MRPVAAVGAIMVMIGLLVRGTASSDQHQLDAVGEKPERVTLQALTERGLQGQRNVIITDFAPCAGYVIIKRVTKQGFQEIASTFERCYVPLVPRRNGPDEYADRAPRQVSIVIHCPLDPGSRATEERCGGPELHGIVEGLASELDPEARSALAQQYPDTDFGKCLVVTEGAKVVPFGPPKVMRQVGNWVMLVGGVLLGVAAVLAVDRRSVTHRS